MLVNRLRWFQTKISCSQIQKGCDIWISRCLINVAAHRDVVTHVKWINPRQMDRWILKTIDLRVLKLSYVICGISFLVALDLSFYKMSSTVVISNMSVPTRGGGALSVSASVWTWILRDLSSENFEFWSRVGKVGFLSKGMLGCRNCSFWDTKISLNSRWNTV